MLEIGDLPVAREFAKAFYHSKQWKDTREAYARARNGLCEKCMRRGQYSIGEIVHHKVHLTPENINDPEITLNHGNLELVCRDCHAAEHPEIYGSNADRYEQRVDFDENGNVVRKVINGEEE